MVGAEWQVGQLVQNTSHAVTAARKFCLLCWLLSEKLVGFECGMWSMNILNLLFLISSLIDFCQN